MTRTTAVKACAPGRGCARRSWTAAARRALRRANETKDGDRFSGPSLCGKHARTALGQGAQLACSRHRGRNGGGDGHGRVDGAIYISPFSMSQYDGSYAVSVQKAHPDKFALVKPVNLDDPAVADVIADWKKTPGTVCIRIILTKESKRAPDDPGLDRILRAAVKNDFPVNVLFWGNVDAGTALIDRHPDARFIIDHMGIEQPSVPPAGPIFRKWWNSARRKNPVITGACTLSKEPYPFPDI